MNYIALLRGINVGGNKTVDMKRLREVFESLGYTRVRTYINSGNVFFSSLKTSSKILAELKDAFKVAFGFDVATLIKSGEQIGSIAASIPESWQNDDEQKTDVAYQFDEIDNPGIISDLPMKSEFVRTIYTKGALIWNVDRKDYSKSNLNKLISHKYYKLMTVRNVNTARYLAKPRDTDQTN